MMEICEWIVWSLFALITLSTCINWYRMEKKFVPGLTYDFKDILGLYAIPRIVFWESLLLIAFIFVDFNKLNLIWISPIIVYFFTMKAGKRIEKEKQSLLMNKFPTTNKGNGEESNQISQPLQKREDETGLEKDKKLEKQKIAKKATTEELFSLSMKIENDDDPQAKLDYGLGWAHGKYTGKPDMERAIGWFQMSAEQNHPIAQYYLGVCYFLGAGVEEDETEAFKWLKKSAEQGCSTAQFNVGKCYIKGYGVKEDIDEGGKWINKASEQNLSEDRSTLDKLFLNGKLADPESSMLRKWQEIDLKKVAKIAEPIFKEYGI